MTQHDKRLRSLRSSHDRLTAAIRSLDGGTDPASRSARSQLEVDARRCERDTCAMAF